MSRPPLFDMQPGPFEDGGFPDRLPARAVDAGPPPRLWGYDAQGDLAVHYSFGEVMLLALTGELAEAKWGRAFEVALTFLCPVSIAEAPVNAAVMARMVASDPQGIAAIAALALGEQAAQAVTAHVELLAWLDGTDRPFPAEPVDEGERGAVARLRNAVGTEVGELPIFQQDPTLIAALLAVLHGCGLRRPEQLVSAWVMARLPAAMAEALAAPRGGYREYPLALPQFHYKGGRDDD